MKKGFVMLLLISLSFLCFAQPKKKPQLIAGPVVGSVTSTSAKIWIAYHGDGSNALILGDTAEKRVYYPSNYSYIGNNKGNVALTMDFTGLKPGHRYNVIVSIDRWGTNTKSSFSTLADTTVKDFNFLLGSCALLIPGVMRPVFPGGADWIFRRMKRKNADFMMWLGDNVYYLKKDYSSYEGMFNLNLTIRKKFKKYSDFLGAQPNYAIWDDHDYGSNDCGKEFALKDTSVKIFRGMWPNTYPENENLQGNFFSFRYYDVEFFMLDDRYFRDKDPDSNAAFLGETQMVWLKNKLLSSDATFKLIALGSQVVNDNTFGETYTQYINERKELLDFITNNNVNGVLFLTGDKHYTELSKQIWNGYPIYDFTCSPLTTPPLPRRLLGAYKNSYRVKKFDYGRRNFGRISFSGLPGSRELKIEILGREGLKKKEIILKESELRRTSP